MKAMTQSVCSNNWLEMRKLLITIYAIAISLSSWAGQPDEIIFSEARFHKGEAPQGWMTACFDDSLWQTIAIPEKWHGEREYAQYRIMFNLPKEFVSQAAYRQYAIFDLSYIDDCDEAYLNGKLSVDFGQTYAKSISLVPGKPFIYDMAYDGSEPMRINVTFLR